MFEWNGRKKCFKSIFRNRPGVRYKIFLTQYPDGTVRKRRRHIEGHNYPIQRKTTGKEKQQGKETNYPPSIESPKF